MGIEAMSEDDIGTVRWFGPSWHAPVCDPRAHVETPVGNPCAACTVALVEGDRGITVPNLGTCERQAWHLDCWLEGSPERVGDRSS
jgi:hypothetical protein